MLTNIFARPRAALTAGLVALSLATLPAPPAEAQDRAQVVAGLATLAILGAILSRAHADDDRNGRVVSRDYAPSPRYYRHSSRHAHGYWQAPHRHKHADRSRGQRHWERQDRRRHDHRR